MSDNIPDLPIPMRFVSAEENEQEVRTLIKNTINHLTKKSEDRIYLNLPKNEVITPDIIIAVFQEQKECG
ncbi:MAG: hypothetical protein ACRC2S_28430 [Waterburya sp.]